MGFKTREVWHKTDWDAVAKNPLVVGKTIGDWVLNHDPEKYAYENHSTCAKHLTGGSPFKNTNSVPGFTYKPWDIRDLLSASEREELVIDEGN